ncbi:MAG: TonB family protein [Acidobacteriota bacterium]
MVDDAGATSAVRAIGRYRAYDELGRGAMGIVYRGFDPVIGRMVALKTLALSGAGVQAKEFRDRLYREAAAAGALSHPGIVTIFDIVEDAGVTAVAMEYIEGRNLASMIEERAPLPLDYAIDLFEQLCSALDYAAASAIIHRDIKPANILLTSAGRVKITDFGVAKLALSTMTQAGTVLGSPSYMSPEQVRGLPLDGRSDLFSATVVFYEMITRERPFAGSDVATTMYRIAHEPPTPPGQFNAAIGPALTAALERALAKNPEDRFRTGADLVAELRRVTSFSSAGLKASTETVAGTQPSRGTPPSGRERVLPSPYVPAPGVSDETVVAAPPTVELPEGVELPSAEAIIAAASGAPAARLAPLPEFGSPPGPVPRTRATRWVVLGGGAAAVLALAVALSLVLFRDRSPQDTGDLVSPAGATDVAVPEVQGAASVLPVPPVLRPLPPSEQALDQPVTPSAPARTATTASGARAARTPPPTAGRPAKPLVPTIAPPRPRKTGTGDAAEPPRGRVYEPGQVDQRPVVTRQVEPVYPPDAARRGVEDVVVLKVVVLATGRVDDVEVLRRSKKDAAFDAAAMAAVRQWEFSPARRDGTAVNCYYNVAVPFQLKR